MKTISFEDYIDSEYFDMDSFVICNNRQYQVKELIELVNNNQINYEDVKFITIL